MLHSYRERFESAIRAIKSGKIKTYARLQNSNSFTRNRNMPLSDILFCTLAKKGLTAVMELQHYFNSKGDSSMKISKQGYLQQRKKLNYKVFSFLNREYLKDFYTSEEPVLWNGYLVLAIDGTKAEVPDSEENRKEFGESRNDTDKYAARALVSSAMDVLNDFFLDIQIASIKSSESELAKANITAIRDIAAGYPILVIMDRGYPSIELVHFLEKNGVHYVFRLSSNDYKKERQEKKTTDEWVNLKHTSQRLVKVRKNHPEVIGELKEKAFTKVRLIDCCLPSSSQMTVMTNLPSEIKGEDITALYWQRWQIEKKYHTLKNKIKLESVTGKASIYVYQDFWSQIYIYNMIQDVLHVSNVEIEKIGLERNYKHPVHVNENIAIGMFKERMIKIVMEPNAKIRNKNLLRLQADIEKHILPIRKLKRQERNFKPSNKYKNNQKNSF